MLVGQVCMEYLLGGRNLQTIVEKIFIEKCVVGGEME